MLSHRLELAFAAFVTLPGAVHGALLQQREVVEWVRSNAIPLQTVEPRHGFLDMDPLRKVVGDAQIVALGEATHGSREFFQLKHRMLEFLVTNMGFRIFAIEANMPEASRLNDYVLTGHGDPAALLQDLGFWTWDTEEVLSMIRWMREFNESGRGPVMFAGFDMQTPAVAERIVDEYVTKSDPEYESSVRAATITLDRVTSKKDSGATAAALLEAADSMWNDIAAHLKSTRASTSTAEAAWALQNAHIVRQSIELRAGRMSRDRSMAENVKWILDQNPDAKIVLWPHRGTRALLRGSAAVMVVTCGLRAQTVRGHVEADVTRKRLAGGVVVAVDTAGHAAAPSAITNANGEFALRFRSSGRYGVSVRRLGYRPIQLSIALSASVG